MKNLFEQLKQRNVFRAAATYVALSWVLLQIIDLVSPILGWPDGVMRIASGVLLLGFIPAIIISWVYEITPEGLKKEQTFAEDTAFRQHVASRMNTVVVLLLITAIVLLALDRYFVREPALAPQTVQAETEPHVEAKIDSIAVLPFADFSAAGDQAYLGEGIADTVLHMLAGVEGLRVAARTSSFRFGEEDVDIATIGQQLSVASVLEGSVQVAGDKLRVIAQLVRTADQSHVWSQTFDRTLEDVFAIQDEIANAIVAEFGGDDQGSDAPIESSRTSPEVYAQVLQARQLMRNRNAPDIERAIELLNRAIAGDTTYATAHSELALALYFSTMYGSAELDTVRPLMAQEIDIALQLNPEDATAYVARAVLWEVAEEREKAIADFRHSLTLNPGDVEVMVWLAESLGSMGEFDASRDLLKRAFETDPLNEKVRFNYALHLMEAHNDTEQAIKIAEETVALKINLGRAQRSLAIMYLRVSRLADATRALFEAARYNPETPASYITLANWFSFLDERELSEKWWQVAIEMRPAFRQIPDFGFRAYHNQGEQLLAEAEAQLMTNPDSAEAIFRVVDVTSQLGRFDRAIELGERYFELSYQSGSSGSRFDFQVAFFLAMIYRIKGLDEEAAFYTHKLETLSNLRTGNSEVPKRLNTIDTLFISLARGDYATAAEILESLPVGKPLAYQYMSVSAFNQLSREDENIQRWLADYGALIAKTREEIQTIEDPEFWDPGLLRIR